MNSSYQPTEKGDFYLYRHIRLDNHQVFYVGIGKKRIKKFKTYKSEFERAFSTGNRTKYWHNIVEKVGYKIEIIFETTNSEEIKRKEVEFINLYGRQDLGQGHLVNFTDGGEGTFNPSDRHRKSMAENGRKQFTGKLGSLSPNAVGIFVYNLDGSFFGKFPSCRDAYKALNITRKPVCPLISRKYPSISVGKGKADIYKYGYLWSSIYLGEMIPKYTPRITKHKYYAHNYQANNFTN